MNDAAGELACRKFVSTAGVVGTAWSFDPHATGDGGGRSGADRRILAQFCDGFRPERTTNVARVRERDKIEGI
jgi:hypothetical protein